MYYLGCHAPNFIKKCKYDEFEDVGNKKFQIQRDKTVDDIYILKFRKYLNLGIFIFLYNL